MGLAIVTIFVDLYPRVMVSSTKAAYSLTAQNTASPPYSLKVTTVVALVLLPFVLAYQAWTYYIFRRRVTERPSSVPAATLHPQQPATSGAATATAGTAADPDNRHPHRGWRGGRG
jgi:cytochrome d ubiquinol oxidase subunit II